MVVLASSSASNARAYAEHPLWMRRGWRKAAAGGGSGGSG
jgi:hypothetical protein